SAIATPIASTRGLGIPTRAGITLSPSTRARAAARRTSSKANRRAMRRTYAHESLASRDPPIPRDARRLYSRHAMEQQAPAVEPEHALVEVEERAPARTLLDIAPEEFSRALERRAMNRASLIRWVREALVEGVDFGRVPTKRGASKPSLWKPGSEKITGM